MSKTKSGNAKTGAELQKKFRESVDQINCNLPKGTKERIRGLGFSCNAFIKDVVLKELDKLEGK